MQGTSELRRRPSGSAQTVDYRLARRAVLRDLRRGLRGLPDVCDAHPELLRAARFIGEEIAERCPVCDKARLRIVFYSFGKGAREQGRARRREDLAELRAASSEYVVYAVEVCTACSWNHLVRSYTTGFRAAV